MKLLLRLYILLHSCRNLCNAIDASKSLFTLPQNKNNNSYSVWCEIDAIFRVWMWYGWLPILRWLQYNFCGEIKQNDVQLIFFDFVDMAV